MLVGLMNAQSFEMPLRNIEISAVTRWSRNRWGTHHPVSVKDTLDDIKTLTSNDAPHSQWLIECVLYLVVIGTRAIWNFCVVMFPF